MAPSTTVELAKKGDPRAIAALMNKSLGAKGVVATASRQGNFLEITLQSQRALNQKTIVDIVQKGMRNLQVSTIERVLIRAEQGNAPNWESEIFLNQSAPQPVPTYSPVNVTKSSISQAIQNPETGVSSSASPPQKYRESSNSGVGIVLLPKLSQLNHSVQKYQDTVVRLTDDTGREIICLCTLAELIRTLYTPASAPQSIADAIQKCSSTNEDGEKIIRNVSILQPGQMWQKIQIRCTWQIAFEMEGTSNLAENLTNPSIYEPEDEEETVLETAPAIATEETLLEYPKAESEDGGDETIIEAISAAKAQEYAQAKTDDELLLNSPQPQCDQYDKLSEPEEDDTVIEGISPAKAREYNMPSRSSQDLFDNMSEPATKITTPSQSEDDILFKDFVFDVTHPPKTINDIDTVSDPTSPPPPQDNLSFTLEDFRSDLLSLV